MAYLTSYQPFSMKASLSLLAAPFKAIDSALDQLGMAQKRIVALERLNDTSDAALEARGLTREDEVKRIFDLSA